MKIRNSIVVAKSGMEKRRFDFGEVERSIWNEILIFFFFW